MALNYARLGAGLQRALAYRFGMRAGVRGRGVQVSDNTREIAVDQERDEWQDFEFAAPLTARAAGPALENSKSYILHKEQGGSWFVDLWNADGAGAVRAAGPAFPAFPAFPAATEQSPANDHSDGCFIIEIGHASR